MFTIFGEKFIIMSERKMINVSMTEDSEIKLGQKLSYYKRKVENPPLTLSTMCATMFDMFTEDPEKVLKFLKLNKK
jgi:hypothetical protein